MPFEIRGRSFRFLSYPLKKMLGREDLTESESGGGEANDLLMSQIFQSLYTLVSLTVERSNLNQLPLWLFLDL